MDNADERKTSRHSPCYLRMLGPLAAWRDGRSVDLGPPLQRAALCVLAAQMGQVVTKDALIGGLWGERPPNTAEQSVYTYVAGLRRILEPERDRRGPYSVLVHRSRGYVLERGLVEVDVEAFERHLAEARAADEPRGSLKALEAALQCWSGPALCGVPGPFAETLRVRLEELRLAAREDRAEALLDLGLHQEAAAALTELVGEAPLRERARDLLMLALYRCGRQADALDTYMEVKRLLAERLGVDPGESLRERYELILRADPSLAEVEDDAARTGPATSPPRQLPRAAGGFVGRVEELVRLRSLLSPWDGGLPQAVITITGAPGAGKSALAIQAAQAAVHSFPDGQLYANLLGATPGVRRLTPVDVLGRLLRGLGVPGTAVPTEPDEAAAMLRDRLQGRRTLILLDDAAGPEQVRALLGLPAGNTVLITSRESFAMADDCEQIVLRSLGRSEAVTVLAKLVGAERIAAEQAEVSRLVELCGGLPLALRLAAARLVERPDWGVADLVARLEDGRRTLHELESGQITIRSSLELSYESLARSDGAQDLLAARVLCHLGVLHVATVTPEVVAALVGESADAVERALGRLVRAHLLESAEAGRFRLHDLVRLFTIELADSRLTPRAQRDALRGALGFYGATARHASTVLDPHRVQLPLPDVPQRPLPLRTPGAAAGWLEEERANILAAVSQCVAAADDDVARLAAYVGFSLNWHLYLGDHRRDQLVLGEQALLLGSRLEDREITALAHMQLAITLTRLGRPAEALPHQQAELALQRDAGDRFGEMRALGNLSGVHVNLGQYVEVLEYSGVQLEIAREIGSQVGERHALQMMAIAHRALGQASLAMRDAREALSSAVRSGDRYHEAYSQRLAAEIWLDQDEPGEAVPCLEHALTTSRQVGHRTGESECLRLLARAHRLLGHPRPALAYAREALAVLREGGDEQTRREAVQELHAVRAAFPESEPLSSTPVCASISR